MSGKELADKQMPAKASTPAATEAVTYRTELEVFDEFMETMAELLVSGNLTVLAGRAAGKRLISGPVKTQALDRSGEDNSRLLRATNLLDILVKKMDKKMEGAAGVMKQFLESVQEANGHLHKYLSDELAAEIKNGTKQPEKEVIELHQQQIAEMLEFSLTSVAGSLMSSKAINSEEHSSVVNPTGSHDEIAVRTILKVIRNSIKLDKSKMKVFLEDVLEEIGGPAEMIAKRMADELKPRAPPAPPENGTGPAIEEDEQIDFN